MINNFASHLIAGLLFYPLDMSSAMAHKIAKLILEHADSIANRTTAIQKALDIGMPLREIENYLDWLDSIRQPDMSEPEKVSSKNPN